MQPFRIYRDNALKVQEFLSCLQQNSLQYSSHQLDEQVIVFCTWVLKSCFFESKNIEMEQQQLFRYFQEWEALQKSMDSTFFLRISFEDIIDFLSKDFTNNERERAAYSQDNYALQLDDTGIIPLEDIGAEEDTAEVDILPFLLEPQTRSFDFQPFENIEALIDTLFEDELNLDNGAVVRGKEVGHDFQPLEVKTQANNAYIICNSGKYYPAHKGNQDAAIVKTLSDGSVILAVADMAGGHDAFSEVTGNASRIALESVLLSSNIFLPSSVQKRETTKSIIHGLIEQFLFYHSHAELYSSYYHDYVQNLISRMGKNIPEHEYDGILQGILRDVFNMSSELEILSNFLLNPQYPIPNILENPAKAEQTKNNHYDAMMRLASIIAALRMNLQSLHHHYHHQEILIEGTTLTMTLVEPKSEKNTSSVIHSFNIGDSSAFLFKLRALRAQQIIKTQSHELYSHWEHHSHHNVYMSLNGGHLENHFLFEGVPETVFHGKCEKEDPEQIQWRFSEIWKAEDGDILFLASDGAYDNIPIPAMQEILNAYGNNPKMAIQILARLAYDGMEAYHQTRNKKFGKPDNLTMIIMKL